MAVARPMARVMTSGYYDSYPLLALPRPVAVTGWLNDLSRAVAYRTAAVLGLPFADLDRLVEHEVGESIGRLVVREGEPAYRAVESDCLQRALADLPAGVVALGDGALLSSASAELVHSQCFLTVLDLDLANLYWRIRRAVSSGQSGDWRMTLGSAPGSLDELRPFYVRRRAAFQRAHYRIDIRHRSLAQASRILVGQIEQLIPR